jgi:hypothetical protein
LEGAATSPWRWKLLTIALVLILGGIVWGERRRFIRSWFDRGPVLPPAERSGPAPSGPVRPVRVVLVDGLTESMADQLPAMGRVCKAGLSLRVDVGFPSVSLPVQHVLWTGTWQGQSGVLFQIDQLNRPVFESLPELVVRRGRNAVAVAENHREIVASFPFSSIVAPAKESDSPLAPLDLQQEALRAVQSSAALAFIHVLALDKAGHEGGSTSAQYRDVARRADELLGQIWQVRSPDWTLVVLSDHGHLRRDPGGHGGPEPEVRWVRACVVGPGIPAGSRGLAEMPDLSRILAQRLNVPPPRRCQGRPLSRVIGSSKTPGQPPPLGRERNSAAMVLGLLISLGMLGLGLGLVGGWHPRRALLLLPWGIVVSVVLLFACLGEPSLSRHYIYRSYPVSLFGVSIPALLVPVLQSWALRRQGLPWSAVVRGMVLVALVLPLGALSLTGWPLSRPPLVPALTAWASTLVHLAVVSLLGVAGWLMVEVAFRRRP